MCAYKHADIKYFAVMVLLTSILTVNIVSLSLLENMRAFVTGLVSVELVFSIQMGLILEGLKPTEDWRPLNG